MAEHDVRSHEVEYSFDVSQEYNLQPRAETIAPITLSTEEFIQKRKAIVDKLIDMSIDPE